MVGYPASGKSTFVEKLLSKYPKNGTALSRDDLGGSVVDLLPKVKELLVKKKVVILDNTHMTKESRKPFIELAQSMSVAVEAMWVKNTIEDSQIKALHRMHQRYGQVFMTGKADKGSDASKDPNVFPPAALFAARKKFEDPSTEEGFQKVTIVNAPTLSWDGRKYRGKAIFFDIDGTLRETEDLPLKYPTKPSEVKLLKDQTVMTERLQGLMKDGYKLIGVSNQSGIAKKTVTESQVKECMQRTRELLGLDEKKMPISWCPHSPAPITCYCRKPQVGMLMHYIENMKLNPKKCLMVGDSKSDETTAVRLGIKFVHSSKFWS